MEELRKFAEYMQSCDDIQRMELKLQYVMQVRQNCGKST